MAGGKDVSLTIRFVWLYGFLAACLVSTFSVILYSFMSQTFLEELRTRAMRVAEIAAAEVDVSAHELLEDPAQMESEGYKMIQQTFRTIVGFNPQVDGIYTMRKTDDPEVLQFVVDSYDGSDRDGDGEVSENEMPAEIGEEYDTTEAPDLLDAFYGPTADRAVTTDKWGQWVSGYYPLRDAEGVVVAIVGADISAEHYWHGLQLIRAIILFLVITSALFSLLCGFLGDLMFRRATKEMSDLRVRDVKTEFISLVSHQLRSPMTAIHWQLEDMLTSGRLSNKQRETLSEATKRVSQMSKLVGDLLNVSRIETGRMKVETKPTKLDLLIRDVISELSPILKERECQVRFKKVGKMATVVTDANLLRQVVENLLTNAIRYSRGRCEIVATLSALKGSYRFAVQDRGIGIPPEAQKHIFEKGFRAENATRVTAEGAGLGLYLCKRIIDALHGRIGFESKEEVGSTFWFEIPTR